MKEKSAGSPLTRIQTGESDRFDAVTNPPQPPVPKSHVSKDIQKEILVDT